MAAQVQKSSFDGELQHRAALWHSHVSTFLQIVRVAFSARFSSRRSVPTVTGALLV